MTREFYDRMSDHYSRDRYLSGITNAVQYSYAQRLNIVRVFARRALMGTTHARILDVGTADGYVLRRIYDDNASHIAAMVGNDIAPKMLEEARRQSTGYPVTFVLRGQEPAGEYNLLMEIGVHMPDPQAEIEWIVERVNHGGYAIITVANRYSWYSRQKLRNKPYIVDYRTFQEYEHYIASSFDILEKRTLGIFIPKLWVLPSFFARLIQTVAEWIIERLAPNTMHERVYLLRLRAPRS